MMPRGFSGAATGGGLRWTGGEIFSNVKAGIAYPLSVELNHSLKFPESCLNSCPMSLI